MAGGLGSQAAASGLAQGENPYQRLSALGLSLLDPPPPIGTFELAVRHGDLLFLSGQGPLDGTGQFRTGKVGADVSAAEAYEHAKLTGLNLISALHHTLGDLGRVRRVVKLLGMVNATPDFADHPAVINGCSDLFVAVFGPAGRHARSAVGFSSLPRGITVEIEAVVAVSP